MDKDTYEQLGLVGKPSQFQKQHRFCKFPVIPVDLPPLLHNNSADHIDYIAFPKALNNLHVYTLGQISSSPTILLGTRSDYAMSCVSCSGGGGLGGCSFSTWETKL